MSLPTQVTLRYVVDLEDPQVIAKLVSALGDVPLDFTPFALIGVTLASDVTAETTSTRATRTIVFNLSSAFFDSQGTDPNAYKSVFLHIFTHTIAGALISRVTTQNPVFS